MPGCMLLLVLKLGNAGLRTETLVSLHLFPPSLYRLSNLTQTRLLSAQMLRQP